MADIHILIVDDEPHSRQPIADSLRREGYIVDEADDSTTATELVFRANGKYDVVLLDQVLGDPPDGIETMKVIKARHPEILTVIFTGYSDRESGVRALREGAYRYIVKPVAPEELIVLIQSIAEIRSLTQRLELTGRETEWLHSSLTITNTMLKHPTRKDVLEEIARAVPGITRADECAIVLAGKNKENLKVYGAPRADWDRHFRDERTSRTIIEKGVAVLIPDATTEPRVNPQVVGSGIKSFAGVPIRAEQGNIGVLWAYGHQVRQVNENTIPLLQLLAGQAAVGIETANLFDKTERRAQEMETLNELSSAVGSTIEFTDVLQKIWEQVQKLVGVSTFFVALYDPKTREIKSEIYYDEGNPCPSFRRKIADDQTKWGLTEYIVAQEKEVLSNDFPKDKAEGRIPVVPVTIGKPSVSWFGIPLVAERELIGVISFQSYERNAFDEDKVRIARAIAHYAAFAIANAKHHQEIQRNMEELDQLRQASRLVASADELPDVLKQITRGVMTVLGANSASVWIYDVRESKFDLDQVVVEGVAPTQGGTLKQQPRMGGTASTIMERGYVFVEDVGDAARYPFIGSVTRQFCRDCGIACFAGIALKVNGEIVGVLYANFNTSRSMDHSEEDTLQAFAYEAALAIKKAKVFGHEQDALKAIENAATFSMLDKLDDTLDAIVERLRQALECDIVTLYPYDQKSRSLQKPKHSGLEHPDKIWLLPHVLPDSPLGKILASGKPYFANDSPNDPIMHSSFQERERVASSAGIPLKVRDLRVGILFVNYRQPYMFTAEDKELLLAFASMAAVAIQNARLYEDVEKNAKVLEMISAAGKAVTASVDRDQVLDQILSQARHLTGVVGNRKEARRAILQLLEGNDLVFVRTNPLGLFDELKASPVFRINLADGIMVDGKQRFGITGRAALTKQAQLVPDITKNDDFLSFGEDTRSELAVPLLSGDTVIGVLNVEHPDIGAFEDADQDALQALATYAVIAIQNAERFKELRNTQRTLSARTAVAYMGIASSTWRHTIGNYATTIVDMVTLTRRLLSEKAPRKKIEEQLASIEAKAKEIRETPTTAPLSKEEGVESIHVNRWLQDRVPQLLKAFDAVHTDLEYNLKLSDEATVRASREWLRRALDNLVKNAIDAMEGLAKKRLIVSTSAVGKTVEIHVSDVGKGIPAHLLQKLLGEPIPKAKGERGSGMGLLQSRTIVQAYGGDIRVGKTDASGTTMVISLPLE